MHAIPRIRERDVVLRSRLAHVTLAGRPIGALTHDEPLPGGYLGTSLTTSLSPEAPLFWTKAQIMQIGRALGRSPMPFQIKQRLLLYGAHSQIAYTHRLMALSPQTMGRWIQCWRAYRDKCRAYPQPFRRPGYTPS